MYILCTCIYKYIYIYYICKIYKYIYIYYIYKIYKYTYTILAFHTLTQTHTYIIYIPIILVIEVRFHSKSPKREHDISTHIC